MEETVAEADVEVAVEPEAGNPARPPPLLVYRAFNAADGTTMESAMLDLCALGLRALAMEPTEKVEGGIDLATYWAALALFRGDRSEDARASIRSSSSWRPASRRRWRRRRSRRRSRSCTSREASRDAAIDGGRCRADNVDGWSHAGAL